MWLYESLFGELPVSRVWEIVALILFGAMGYVCVFLLIIFRKKSLKEAKVLWRS